MTQERNVSVLIDEAKIAARNSEIAQEIAPELWQAHVDYVDQSMIELFEAGLLNVEYDENLEATIHLTKEGYEVAKKHGLIDLENDEHDI